MGVKGSVLDLALYYFLGNGVPSPCGSKEDSEVFGEVNKYAGLSQSFQMWPSS